MKSLKSVRKEFLTNQMFHDEKIKIKAKKLAIIAYLTTFKDTFKLEIRAKTFYFFSTRGTSCKRDYDVRF